MFRIKKLFTPLVTQTLIKRAMHDRKLPSIVNNNFKTTNENTIIGKKSDMKEDSIKLQDNKILTSWKDYKVVQKWYNKK